MLRGCIGACAFLCLPAPLRFQAACCSACITSEGYSAPRLTRPRPRGRSRDAASSRKGHTWQVRAGGTRAGAPDTASPGRLWNQRACASAGRTPGQQLLFPLFLLGGHDFCDFVDLGLQVLVFTFEFLDSVR